MKAWSHLQKFMKPKEKSLFLRVRKVFKDKKEWMVVTDNFYHPNWLNVRPSSRRTSFICSPPNSRPATLS
jgi:hypothetical protein